MKKIIILFSIFYFLFSLSSRAFAAEISLQGPSTVAVGDRLTLTVILDTEGEIINAVEGTINYPDSLELTTINDAQSVINLWIKRPQLNEKGVIHFAGITPGGYRGAAGKIVTAVFRVPAGGAGGSVRLTDARALLNDGRGTPAKLRIEPYAFTVAADASSTVSVAVTPAISDTQPPQMAPPYLARDATVSDNQWFLIFTARDDQSGIREYQVQESWFDKWHVAESPYLLKDQAVRGRISIKAIDNAGNEQVATIAPLAPWYQRPTVWGILGVIVIFTFIFLWCGSM